MVPQYNQHLTAHRSGFFFQFVKKPQESRDVVPPIEQVAEQGERARPPPPVAFRIDQSRPLEQRGDAVELPVYVPEQIDRVGNDQFDRGRHRRVETDPRPIEPARFGSDSVFDGDERTVDLEARRVCISGRSLDLVDQGAVDEGAYDAGGGVVG